MTKVQPVVVWNCGYDHHHLHKSEAVACEKYHDRAASEHERRRLKFRYPWDCEPGLSGLGPRARRILFIDGVLSREDVAKYSRAELLRFPGLGLGTLREIEAWADRSTGLVQAT